MGTHDADGALSIVQTQTYALLAPTHLMDGLQGSAACTRNLPPPRERYMSSQKLRDARRGVRVTATKSSLGKSKNGE
ncbi:hypothetical protein CHELA40_14524 [Chelatococcus asaccharovorans]|nr:hypothetical protein CHELA17_61096 [Chelatococcus asaccharovorans]CAH1678133.1 hypothetical protein CHELA40_14524 [Chelatococcus asaccharovorans]